jgi:hypothetical protein
MKYLIIYLEIEHMLNFLSQSEKGDFLDLMIAYAKNQKNPLIENKNVLNVFNFIRGRLDAQFEKARIKAEVARKNGAGGGRPPSKKKPKKTNTKPEETQLVIEELTKGLKFILEDKLNKNINSNSWKEDIRKLLEIDLKQRANPIEDIKKAIQAVADYAGEQYFPVIQSARSLREKFTKIEGFLTRNSKQSGGLSHQQLMDLDLESPIEFNFDKK